MEKTSRLLALSASTVALATIFVIAFAWFGPGVSSISPSASAALFDEEQVENVYDRVNPAVVEISVDRQSRRSAYMQIGSGSGFLLDNEGHIATNYHVVEAADRVRVSFPNGKSATAEVVGRNPANDLALLKVDPAVVEGITPLALADSDQARPGQLAIAIGSPFGLTGSVTVGVISGINRDLPTDLGRPISGVLQTDALINPGNSGGPLLNRQGQVIGINTAIQVPPNDLTYQMTGRHNIGFAVPSNTLAHVLPQLKTGQEVRPPWLGISAMPVSANLAESLGLSVTQGVYVTQVAPDSPAEQAGLVGARLDELGRPAGGGDIITHVEGQQVNSVSELVARLNRHRSGDMVTLRIVRGEEREEVTATLGEWPEQLAPRASPPLEEPQQWTPRRRYGFPEIPGFPIPPVLPGNPAR